MVNSNNQEIILKSDKPKVTVDAKDRVIGSTSPQMQAKILHNFATNQHQTCQLLTALTVCEGIC